MDFPVCATRFASAIRKDRLQLYIRPHRRDAGAGHYGNLALIHEAIEFHLEGLKEDGQPIPPPSSSNEIVEVAA